MLIFAQAIKYLFWLGYILDISNYSADTLLKIKYRFEIMDKNN